MSYFLFFLLLMPVAWAQSVQQAAEGAAQLDALIDEVISSPECAEERAKKFQLNLDGPEEAAAPVAKSVFPRTDSGIPVACGGGEEKGGYDELYIVDCLTKGPAGEKKYFSGYRMKNGPGHPYFKSGGKTTRSIDIVSRNSASNETYLYLSDTAGGPDSEDVKSVMLIIPRKVVPSVQVAGNEVRMTLTTGEKVTFDKTSHAITSGALKEGVPDFRADRLSKTPPNVQYTGSGISIRLNHRFLHPTLSSPTAEIKQGTHSCTIPRTALYDAQGKLKTISDAQLLGSINKACPAPFHL